jgi:hypothetical protein
VKTARAALIGETRMSLRRSSAPPVSAVQWAADKGIHWWSAQRLIAESVERNKRTVVRAGHGVGKSFTAAGLAAWWVSTHPDSLVVSSAPSYKQVHGVLWEEIRKLHGTLKLPGRVLDSDEWKLGGRQAGFGAKPPDAAKGSDFDPSLLQGYHRAGGVLVILDEAGGLPDWLWTSAETITTTENSRILAIGNPDNPGSRFAEVSKPGAKGWAQHKISVFDSPNYTGEDVPLEVARALTPRSWAPEMADEWGIDSPLYISKVLAEFPSDHPHQVIPLAALLACRIPEPRAAGDLVPVELGVDVGGGGDLTVVRERRGMRAGRRWAARTPEPEQAAELVMRAILESGAVSVKVDAIGVGWGLAGDVRQRIRRGDVRHDCKVHAVKVSEAASDPKRFKNLRSQLWWMGRELSQQQAWDLSGTDGADTVCGELALPRWKPDPAGRVQVEPKDDIRARTGGKSPDDADALLLAYYVPRDATGAYWDALTSGKLGLCELFTRTPRLPDSRSPRSTRPGSVTSSGLSAIRTCRLAHWPSWSTGLRACTAQS